ncbi:MAG: porin [Methyloligellaceae bacterium]
MNGANKSRKIALSTLAALFGAGLSGVASTSAFAGGDIGGNCCADLEERVAELEATTARKGNRKVSLRIYGQVNRAVMHWDDGIESDTYVVDNVNSSSRFGFIGGAKIRPGWSAGYHVELEFDTADSDGVTLADDDAGGTNGVVDLRLSNWWIKSDHYGKITVGQQWFATGDAAAQDLSGTGVANNSFVADFGGGLSFKRPVAPGGSVAFGTTVNEYDMGRGDAVRYDSPTFAGFTLSAAWGEDDTSDVALYFAKTYQRFKVAAAIGAASSSDEGADFEQVSGSLSVLHIPSGLNITVAAGDRDTNASTLNESYVYVKGGLIRKINSLGDTAMSVSYYDGDEIVAATGDTTHIGFELVQNIDAAAMQLYAAYSHNEYKTSTVSFYDLDVITAGARIKF